MMPWQTHMERVTMTLTDFLRARFDEDEAAARAAIPDGRPLEMGAAHWRESALGGIGDLSGFVVSYRMESSAARGHMVRHDPARVLAEVEAKRRIVDDTHYALGMECGFDSSQAENLLKFLALPYADHPDYREEWRP